VTILGQIILCNECVEECKIRVAIMMTLRVAATVVTTTVTAGK